MDDRERSKVSRRGFLAMGCCAAGLGVTAGSGTARAQGQTAGRGPWTCTRTISRSHSSRHQRAGRTAWCVVRPLQPECTDLHHRRRPIPIDVTYWDLHKRIERMDAQGVTTHALSLTTPFVYWATPERGAELARIVNDSMIEAHTAYPSVSSAVRRCRSRRPNWPSRNWTGSPVHARFVASTCPRVSPARNSRTRPSFRSTPSARR